METEASITKKINKLEKGIIGDSSIYIKDIYQKIKEIIKRIKLMEDRYINT